MKYRTDLAIENPDISSGKTLPGVRVSRYSVQKIMVDRVDVTSEEGEKITGKSKGSYFTFDIAPLNAEVDDCDDVVEAVAGSITSLMPKEGLALVVGLGNNDITPDALGPKTIASVLATRHIPGDVASTWGLDGLRPVAALSPGVLGQTGMEVSEIVHSITKDIAPAVVIVVDALASLSLDRLGSTVQLSDSGISPGSGVLNKRKELSLKTLGVPVISLGVPTVVDATTLAGGLLKNRDDSTDGMFSERGRSMMVTPRDIDALIKRSAKILSLAINRALQPSISAEDLSYLVS